MSTATIEHARRRRDRLIGLIGLLSALVLVTWVVASPWLGFALPVLAAALGLVLMSLALNTEAQRLTDPRSRLGPAAIAVAGLLIYGVGVDALLAGGARPSFIGMGALGGVVLGAAVVGFTALLPVYPRPVQAGLVGIVVAAVLSAGLAVSHTTGLIRAGGQATLIAGAYLGLLAGLSLYVAATLWRGGPAGVFPGVTAYLRERRLR